jgi:EARP and GARP complex-interacting protein 1
LEIIFFYDLLRIIFFRPAPLKDGVLAVYEEHEDSVYAVEWSSGDPWTFASLSYDGRLIINRVPKSEKYKLLL